MKHMIFQTKSSNYLILYYFTKQLSHQTVKHNVVHYVSMIIYNTVKTLHVQGVQAERQNVFNLHIITSMFFMLQVKI